MPLTAPITFARSTALKVATCSTGPKISRGIS